MVVVAQMTQMIGPQLEALRKMTYCFYSSQNISATLALLSNTSPPIKKLRSRSQKCLFQKHLICFMAPEKIQRYVITNVLTFGLHFDPHFEIFSHLVHGWQLDFLAMFLRPKQLRLCSYSASTWGTGSECRRVECCDQSATTKSLKKDIKRLMHSLEKKNLPPDTKVHQHRTPQFDFVDAR